jgi:hypothetical protein
MAEGISNFAVEADLRDRSVICVIDPLAERKLDEELASEFERACPGILGALLDLMVIGVRQLPDTRLKNPPRMADAATWAVACGLTGFEVAYADNLQAATNVALQHDVLALSLQALVKKQWKGTAQALLDELGPTSVIKVANPKALSDDLRRLAPMLRTVGIDVRFEKRLNITRPITITRR